MKKIFLYAGLLLFTSIILGGCNIGPYECKLKESNIYTNPPTNESSPSSEINISPSVDATESTELSPTVEPELEEIFQNHNIMGVINEPTAPTIFTISENRLIYSIQDYHWNNAHGKIPGEISLENENGDIFGPWPAEGSPGQGGVPDAYWTSYPDEEIPAGTYTIIDSDPESWSQNSATGGSGMSRIFAVK